MQAVKPAVMSDAFQQKIVRLLRHRGVWGVIALLIVVRVVALVILAPTLDFNREGNAIHGSEAYDAYAQNLLASGVYGRTLGEPDAQIPPLYSYALALVYGLFGRNFIVVGAFHILLDVLSAILLIDIARRLFREQGGLWIGLLAGVFFACYPYLVFQNLTVVDTPFWITLLHLFVWLMIRLREEARFSRQAWVWSILGGLVLGIATLTRPITPPLALFVALWFLFRLSFWQSVFRLLPVALISMLCVGVWIARNWMVFGAFIPMTTTSGSNFWQGNSEWVIPVFTAGYDVQWTAPEERPSINDKEANSVFMGLATQFLSENTNLIPELLWVKFTVLWNPNITPYYNPRENEQWELDENGQLRIIQAESSITGVTNANVSYNDSPLDTIGRPLHLVYFGTLLLLATVGLFWSFRHWREASLLWFVQISMTFMYMTFHPSTRYRSPSDPLLFILSAMVIVWAWQRWQANRRRIL